MEDRRASALLPLGECLGFLGLREGEGSLGRSWIAWGPGEGGPRSWRACEG